MELRNSAQMCLQHLCFQAVREHFSALGTTAVLGLPTHLIKDLLPHLTVCQLDELQPTLNQRGISTHSRWVAFLEEICAPNHVMNVQTEEESKREVMWMLFTHVFYGRTNRFINRNMANLNTTSFFCAAVRCVRHFLLSTRYYSCLEDFTAQQRPLLNFLEKHIRSVNVSQCIDTSKRKTQIAFYILHRLLDHGLTNEVVIHVQNPIILAWLLCGRGTQHIDPVLKNLIYSKKIVNSVAQTASLSAGEASCSVHTVSSPFRDGEDPIIPNKYARLDSGSVQEKEETESVKFTLDPQVLCQHFSAPDEAPTATCLKGRIECLELRQCRSESLRVLTPALPTFFCLRSLTLYSFPILDEGCVLDLVHALRQLSHSSHSSLSELSISVLPCSQVFLLLLDSCPGLRSLQGEICFVSGPSIPPPVAKITEPHQSELPLKSMTFKVAELQTDLRYITSALRHCPHLTSVHIAGLRLPTGSSQSMFLSTLSESNRCLRSLTLENMNLSDCNREILNLLRECRLEELRLNDCRLLEKCSNKEESLRELVAAMKTLSSLHSLSLAQNRLAKYVRVLAELFSGSSSSSVKRLDIRSNFIQPAELLEFSTRLRTHPLPHQLTLDVRENPADRDRNTWNTAVRSLHPFCKVLSDGWTSTNTMADHISNM